MSRTPSRTEPQVDVAGELRGPLLRVVRGEPSTEELAALLAVVAAYAAPAGKDHPAGAISAWSAPSGALRHPVATGADAWVVSGWRPGVRTRAAF